MLNHEAAILPIHDQKMREYRAQAEQHRMARQARIGRRDGGLLATIAGWLQAAREVLGATAHRARPAV